MAELEEECTVQCPYCAESISVLIDLTAGREQSFTTDCEICCQPIVISATVTEDGVECLEAERELS